MYRSQTQRFHYFYYKEHLFIVTELLRDNLYEFYKYNRLSGQSIYFTMNRLQKITQQCLVALDFIHNLDIIHCDLKPENILIKSYRECRIKVIDFGSSCYIHDDLSTYVQSRSYRAPEVILGCSYDTKIDIWSLGCILGELLIGNVLFQNTSPATLLARIIGTIGKIPTNMLEEGKFCSKFVSNGNIYETENGENIIIPIEQTPLEKKIPTNDLLFLDFLGGLLRISPKLRLSAKSALLHPWLNQKYPEDLLDDELNTDDSEDSF